MNNFQNSLEKLNTINKERQHKEFPDRKFPFDYTYFENHDCEFWNNCHKSVNYDNDGFNCAQCRCGLFWLSDCPGIESGDASILSSGIKDCSNCIFPHKYSNREQMSRVFIHTVLV